MIGLFCAGGQSNAIDDQVNVGWYFKDLLLSYKFGEKGRFERSLKALRPYMDDKLYSFFEEIHDNTTWLNPITGKKGF